MALYKYSSRETTGRQVKYYTLNAKWKTRDSQTETGKRFGARSEDGSVEQQTFFFRPAMFNFQVTLKVDSSGGESMRHQSRRLDLIRPDYSTGAAGVLGISYTWCISSIVLNVNNDWWEVEGGGSRRRWPAGEANRILGSGSWRH